MCPIRFGVSYDFRNPPDSGVSNQQLYAEILDQVRWLDQIGADMVWFTEHHFVDDGYLPSWGSRCGGYGSGNQTYQIQYRYLLDAVQPSYSPRRGSGRTR